MKVWKCWNGIGVCLFFRSVVRHSIVHRALLDFLTHCDHTSRSVSSVFFSRAFFTDVLLLMIFYIAVVYISVYVFARTFAEICFFLAVIVVLSF